MNNYYYGLANEAGFCFWGDEAWKPPHAVIDWGADYSTEFNRFCNLIEIDRVTLQEKVKQAIEKLVNGNRTFECLDVLFDILKLSPEERRKLNAELIQR